ncbi:MAG: tetratricopeptide repeat protein [Chloroflexota bacterium]|nr:MAG: tetratricopeptide repeat protein [Chloroflexota bacterium]
MGDTNEINMGQGAQAKQVAAGSNISQTIIENYFERARLSDARFSLPAPPRDFTGRADEIETLVKALTQGHGAAISGLSGMGGIGKSALAAFVANRVAEKFPDAQIWIALNGTDKNPKTPPDAMREIIFALDPEMGAALKDASDAQLAQVYLGLLHNQRALLVLDNARDNAQVRPLLQANVSFLITARANLTEGGLRSLHLGVMKKDEAEAYLISLCPRLSPLLGGEGAGGEVVAKLCEVCGYLPLALKIAGSYLAARQNVRAENYLAQLRERRLELLREGREAEANVEATFEQTYAQLDAALQLLFRALSVFPAPFTLQAAAYVWGLDEPQAEAALGELMRMSFLEFGMGDGRRETGDGRLETGDGRQGAGDRYFLHDLLREFGVRRITNNEQQTTNLRHAEFYVQVARAAKELYKRGNENVRAGLDLFDQELAHIRAGQAWAAANMESDDDAARLCCDFPDAAVYVASLRLSAREQIRWLEQAVGAARKLGDKSSEGVHLGNLGVAYAALGEVRRAIEFYEKYLAIAREIGDRRGEGNALGNLGVVYAALGEVRRAIEYHEQALVIDREIGNRRGQGSDLGNLGLAYAALGEVRRAIEYHEQALVIDREIGNRRGEGNALGNLGVAYYSLGEVRRAIEFYEQYLAIAREIGDRRGEGNALGNLGVAYKNLGDMNRAKELWRAALAIFEAIESPNAEVVRGWLSALDRE